MRLEEVSQAGWGGNGAASPGVAPQAMTRWPWGLVASLPLTVPCSSRGGWWASREGWEQKGL